MYQQERLDAIMRLLEKNNYVTVEFLVNEIKYSPASVRRDLTLLEKQGLVKRSYGGVTLRDANYSPFRFRQHSMKIAKKAMAKKAAELVKDGDVVIIDGSTTAQYIGHFLIDKKDITVITCNIFLAEFLSENGVTVYSPGGRIVEAPCVLGGELMLKGLSNFSADIAFFASTALGDDGKILTPNEREIKEFQLYRERAKRLAYICGSDKFDCKAPFVALTLDDVDYFISDKPLPEELKARYSGTSFICAE